MSTKQWKDYNDTEKGIVGMLAIGAFLIELGVYVSFGGGATLMTGGLMILLLAVVIAGGKR